MDDICKKLRKAGHKLTPLPSLSPKQKRHIQRINQRTRQFLKMMDGIRRSAARSKLKFNGEAITVYQHRKHPTLSISRIRE